MQLHLDRDGVLADFDRAATELLRMSPRQFEKRHGLPEFWKRLARHPDFYGSLPLMPDAMILFEAVRHLDPIILTGLPRGTLGALAKATGDRRRRPEDQVAQWLFAFDAAGIATFRALAVFASDPALVAHARDDASPDLPFLRACLLDTVRLWPTTPAVLRQTDRETRWGEAVMPAATGVLIHLPFLHRDDERLPFAHRFAPDVWLAGEGERWGLIPFSGGPGECPARNFVLLLGSLVLQSLVRERRFEMPAGEALDTSALPPTFDHFGLTIRIDQERVSPG